MRIGLYLLIGIVSYVFFVLLYLPAQHAFSWLPDDMIPVSFKGVSGTLWQGAARQTFYENQSIGSSKWHFKPPYLLLGLVKYEFNLADDNQNLQGLLAMNVFTGAYNLSGLKGTIEANKIPRIIDHTYLKLKGELGVDIQELQISHERITQARGRMQWSNAMIVSPVRSNLGILQFDFTGDAGVVKTEIKDIEGPLKVNASIDLEPDGKYQIRGKVKQNDASSKNLTSFLRTLGNPLSDGSIQINQQGQL